MRVYRRASALLAGMLLVTVASAWAKEPAALSPGPDPSWRQASDIGELTEILEEWLDREGSYPRRGEAVSVAVVEGWEIPPEAGMWRLGMRGAYDPEARKIYLMQPWSRHDVDDAAVLLHELVHHRQQTARHWYCPGQQELPAYRLQEAWLAERHRALDVNWMAVTLESGCMRRDIHPD